MLFCRMHDIEPTQDFAFLGNLSYPCFYFFLFSHFMTSDLMLLPNLWFSQKLPYCRLQEKGN